MTSERKIPQRSVRGIRQSEAYVRDGLDYFFALSHSFSLSSILLILPLIVFGKLSTNSICETGAFNKHALTYKTQNESGLL